MTDMLTHPDIYLTEEHPGAIDLANAYLCWIGSEDIRDRIDNLLSVGKQKYQLDDDIFPLHSQFKGVWRSIDALVINEVARLQQVAAESNQPCTILEVGAGNSLGTKTSGGLVGSAFPSRFFALHADGIEVLATDIQPNLFKDLEKLIFQLTFLDYSEVFNDAAPKEDKFDLIFARCLNPEDRIDFENFRAKLKPDGKILYEVTHPISEIAALNKIYHIPSPTSSPLLIRESQIPMDLLVSKDSQRDQKEERDAHIRSFHTTYERQKPTSMWSRFEHFISKRKTSIGKARR